MPGSHFNGKVELIKKGESGVINIPPQALNVIWGGDNRYWNIKDQENTPAELVQVCWLEVTGKIPVNLLDQEKEYRLVFNLERKPDAFGWKESPVRIMVRPDKRRPTWKRCDLGDLPLVHPSTTSTVVQDSQAEKVLPALKFQVPKDASGYIQFGMYEIWTGTWKGGLIIKSVQVIKN